MKDEDRKKLAELKRKMEGKELESRDSESQGKRPAEASRGRGARSFPEVNPKKAFGGREAPRKVSPSPARAALPPEPERGEGPTVNIGVDLGTSTIKVCARSVRGVDERLDVYAIALGGSSAGRTLLCPSTIVIDAGRVYFGDEAEQRASRDGVRAFRQLKACVACEAGGVPQRPIALLPKRSVQGFGEVLGNFSVR